MTDNDSAIASASATTSALIWSYLWPLVYRGSQFAAGLLVVVGGLLYVQQESLLYFPTVAGLARHNRDNPRGYRHPGERGLAYTEHEIAVDDDGVKIHAWFIPHPSRADAAAPAAGEEKLPTILFFHGNAGNIGLRIPNAVELLRHVRANFVLVEYRGYGDSSDHRPTEDGLSADALAAYRYVRDCVALRPRVDATRLYVMGRSLGGAVAVSLAADLASRGTPLAGLLLENTFTSISDMVDVVLPVLKPIKALVLRIGWDSLGLLESTPLAAATPILFLAGDADALVPHAHMQRLYTAALQRAAGGMSTAAAHAAVSWHVVRGGTHNETWLRGGRAYWQAVANFLADTRPAGGGGGSSDGVAMTNGGTSSTSGNGGGEASAIPLMSQSLTGMARDAWSNKNDKKKET